MLLSPLFLNFYQVFLYLNGIYRLTNIFTDLKAFERRLTEIVASLQPPTCKWRSTYS